MAKSKLTEDLISRIVPIIEEGNFAEVAYSSVGIGKTTFYRWLSLGEKATTGVYRDFWNAIKKAEAIAETRYLGVIRDAANSGNWTAAAWYLERRYPDRWGKKDRMDVTSGGEALRIVVKYADSNPYPTEAA